MKINTSLSRLSHLSRARTAEGALQVGSKEKRNHSAKTLERLGALPQKGPRMSAKIGIGIMKSREKKAARARQEAIDSGMGFRHGGGKNGKPPSSSRAGGGTKRHSGNSGGGTGENKLDRNGVLKIRGKTFKKKR